MDEDIDLDDRELYEHYRFVADKGQSLLRVDKFLNDRIEGISRTKIQDAAEGGFLFANGTPIKANYKVKHLKTLLNFAELLLHYLLKKQQ